MITNEITGNTYNIVGRGLVFECLSCEWELGDTFNYKDKKYQIRGIETMGGRRDKVGLLVRKL